MASADEISAMRHAVALSAFGLGSTSPNPPVGCVILDSGGRIVGQGFHARKGEAHAEVNALAAAGRRAHQGTALVTLEPCNHQGRTPACRQALLDAGISRVIIAVMDPTSRGEGGAAVLRSAGVDVEIGLLADEARQVLGSWLTALQTQRPQVIWAFKNHGQGPVSLDRTGAELTELRRGVDAVLGAGRRIEEGVPGAHGREVFRLAEVDRGGDLPELVNQLYASGVRTLLLDIGSWDAEPFLAAGLIDRVVAFVGGAGPLPRRKDGHGLVAPFPVRCRSGESSCSRDSRRRRASTLTARAPRIRPVDPRGRRGVAVGRIRTLRR